MDETKDLLTYYEITSLQDTRYDAWLDIYQSSFPLPEQMLVSALNRIVRALDADPTRRAKAAFVLAVSTEGEPVGIAQYTINTPCEAGMLWYLAVRSDIRSKGYGALIYQEVVCRMRAYSPALKALLYEVEDPQHCEQEQERHLAERRIAFYRRHGGKLVGGIHYEQSVGWQPPMCMHLMIHDLSADNRITSANVFDLLRCAFQESVTATGAITLT